MRFSTIAAAFFMIAAIPAHAETLDGLPGDGQTDVTKRIQRALDEAPFGATLHIPAGHYRLTSTLVITKPITITGSGLGTQLYEQSDATLFLVKNTNGVVLSNLYLGSSAVSAGTSLVELANAYHNRLDNITMLGGFYGLHLNGALLNTIVDLRSGTNFQGFYAPTSITNTWVYAEAHNDVNGVPISSNANTFIAPVLEGGINGMSINDNAGQGSVSITGGTIEGVKGTALTFNKTFLPSVITQTDFEANGADIVINNASNISFYTINSVSSGSQTDPSISYISLLNDTRNIVFNGGVIDQITIGASTKRIRLENITTATGVRCDGTIVNNNPGTSQTGEPNVVLSQIGYYCHGQ